ncbi:hypothetical protein N8933_03785 [Pseudomonadales bacterium]|nr:hypothetical protein [Pseudomonadales bacterium]
MTNKEPDLTGRATVVHNLLVSWGSYLVFIAAGFIMPRMIDANVGQESLGVWDFCWSITNYISMANLGVGSSINRFVAKYRAAGDVYKLRVAVSSVCFIQSIIAFFVLTTVCLILSFIPLMFGEQLGTQTTATRWIIGAVGLSLVIELITDGARGVITGCHRWDLLNGVLAATRAITIMFMLFALLFGGGIIALGLIHLVVSASSALLRVIIAFRICPELKVQTSYIKKEQAKKMLGFGINTVAIGLPPLILTQTASILILTNLGPTMVAVFARPIALVHHIESFVNKFSFLMTPMAGAIKGTDRESEARKLVLTSTRYSTAFTFPLLSFLVVFGDEVLILWMGHGYVNWVLIASLSIGNLLVITQGPIVRVLIGVDLHGQIGFLNLALVLIIFSLGTMYLNHIGWDLDKVGILVAIPLTIGSGVFIPLYACKRLNIELRGYLGAIIRPTLCGLGFTVSLLITRFAYLQEGLIGLMLGLTFSGLLLITSYWFIVIPPEHQKRLTASLKKYSY